MMYEIPNVVMEVSQPEEKNHFETVNKHGDDVKRKVCNSVAELLKVCSSGNIIQYPNNLITLHSLGLHKYFLNPYLSLR